MQHQRDRSKSFGGNFTAKVTPQALIGLINVASVGHQQLEGSGGEDVQDIGEVIEMTDDGDKEHKNKEGRQQEQIQMEARHQLSQVIELDPVGVLGVETQPEETKTNQEDNVDHTHHHSLRQPGPMDSMCHNVSNPAESNLLDHISDYRHCRLWCLRQIHNLFTKTKYSTG